MGKKILIVDDERDILDLYAALAKKEGCDVRAASSGEEALAAMKEGDFDLDLLDLFMPGMSGKQVLEAIHSNPRLKNLRVVFLTVADSSTTGRGVIKQFASVEYVQKPLSVHEFVSTLRRLLG